MFVLSCDLSGLSGWRADPGTSTICVPLIQDLERRRSFELFEAGLAELLDQGLKLFDPLLDPGQFLGGGLVVQPVAGLYVGRPE